MKKIIAKISVGRFISLDFLLIAAAFKVNPSHPVLAGILLGAGITFIILFCIFLLHSHQQPDKPDAQQPRTGKL